MTIYFMVATQSSLLDVVSTELVTDLENVLCGQAARVEEQLP